MEPILPYMLYMSRSNQNLWRTNIFSHTFTEFCFLHSSPYIYCSWRQPYKLFPRSFLVLGTRDLISNSYHINTEGWLFRSCCQHTAGIPFRDPVCSRLKVFAQRWKSCRITPFSSQTTCLAWEGSWLSSLILHPSCILIYSEGLRATRYHIFVFHCPTVDKVSLLFPLGDSLRLRHTNCNCAQHCRARSQGLVSASDVRKTLELMSKFTPWTPTPERCVVIHSLSWFSAHWHSLTDIKRDNVMFFSSSGFKLGQHLKRSLPH